MLSTSAEENGVSHFEWRREKIRYDVLRWVYEQTGASCDASVTGTQIGAALGLPYEELYRVVHFLEDRGYLRYLGAGPRVCITEKGIHYLEVDSRKRRSIRG